MANKARPQASAAAGPATFLLCSADFGLLSIIAGFYLTFKIIVLLRPMGYQAHHGGTVWTSPNE